MVFGMDNVELQEIIVSVLAIAFAFAVANGVVENGVRVDGIAAIGMPYFWLLFAITLVTVGLGFVLHELAHRYVARSYGAYAVYRAWPMGLMLMIVLALIGGPVFAAPGAVYIYSQYISRKENGIISVAGPLTNVALALMFAFLSVFVPASSDPLMALAKTAFSIGFSVNVFLALFNMIPIFPLDGSKVFNWDKWIWGSIVVGCLVLYFVF